jgi:hypothetical protein
VPLQVGSLYSCLLGSCRLRKQRAGQERCDCHTLRRFHQNIAHCQLLCSQTSQDEAERAGVRLVRAVYLQFTGFQTGLIETLNVAARRTGVKADFVRHGESR